MKVFRQVLVTSVQKTPPSALMEPLAPVLTVTSMTKTANHASSALQTAQNAPVWTPVMNVIRIMCYRSVKELVFQLFAKTANTSIQ